MIQSQLSIGFSQRPPLYNLEKKPGPGTHEPNLPKSSP